MIKRYCDWCGADIEKEYYQIKIIGEYHHRKTLFGYYDLQSKDFDLCEKSYNDLNNYLNKKDS